MVTRDSGGVVGTVTAGSGAFSAGSRSGSPFVSADYVCAPDYPRALAESAPEATARFDRLEATMTTLASLVAAMVQAPGFAAAASPPPAPLMALPTTPTPAPLLLVGHGTAPPGYIDVGVATDGRPLWARADEEAPVPFEALN